MSICSGWRCQSVLCIFLCTFQPRTFDATQPNNEHTRRRRVVYKLAFPGKSSPCDETRTNHPRLSTPPSPSPRRHFAPPPACYHSGSSHPNHSPPFPMPHCYDRSHASLRRPKLLLLPPEVAALVRPSLPWKASLIEPFLLQ